MRPSEATMSAETASDKYHQFRQRCDVVHKVSIVCRAHDTHRLC